MSDRRPPKAWHDVGQKASDQAKSSNVSIADREESSDHEREHQEPADAATLGFADLTEHAPGQELAAFRDLRAKLFGDLDAFEPGFEESDIEPNPSTTAAPEPFVPEQVSIANGALTAAEIAAADDAFTDDEAEESQADPIEVHQRDLVEPEVESEQDLDAAADPATAAEPEPELDWQPDRGPEPVGVAPTREVAADPTTAFTPPHQSVRTTVERSHRKGPIFAVLALVVVGAAVTGVLLLGDGDDADQAAPAGTGVASQDTQVQQAASIEIDGESLRASEQLAFDQTISQITLALPDRPADVATGDFDIKISDIEISVPGQPDQQVSGGLDNGTTSVTIDLDHPSDGLIISYSADGAVVRTEPSSAHRAKALVTPVQISAAAGSTSTVVVKGDVLNLGCLTPGDSMQACGDQTDAGWGVAPETPETDVIAQVNLPQD